MANTSAAQTPGAARPTLKVFGSHQMTVFDHVDPEGLIEPDAVFARTIPHALDRLTRADSRSAARNVVLVHGLFADGSTWAEVIRRLDRESRRARMSLRHTEVTGKNGGQRWSRALRRTTPRVRPH
jgi:hypothetical protein